jgi:hypothetical protein
MLAIEHSLRQSFYNAHLDTESNIPDPYPNLDMNPYASLDSTASFASLPFSYYENPALFVEAPHDSFPYGLHRSTSSNSSLKQSSHSSELPPSLLSSASGPSIHSASSSTVGSPFSGYSHPISTQDSWSSSRGLGLNPTIVNHEGFAADFVGADLEPELAYTTHEKLRGNFVGECTDISFPNRSSTFPLRVSSQSLCVPPNAPFSASPEPLSVECFQNPASTKPSALPIAARSSAHSPATPVDQERQQSRSRKPIFKSPTIPASAQPRTPTVVSPALVRSATVQTIPPPPALSQSTSYAAVPMQQHANQFQNHFFAQSSGSFIPPLELSCSFSPCAVFWLSEFFLSFFVSLFLT